MTNYIYSEKIRPSKIVVNSILEDIDTLNQNTRRNANTKRETKETANRFRGNAE